MAIFPQAVLTEQTAAIYTSEPTGRIVGTPDALTQLPYPASDALIGGSGVLTTNTDNKQTVIVETWNAIENNQSSGGFDWFEDFHVIPRSFEFGNLLSPQSSPIEVFSAFRRLVKEWTSFVNNAGAGTELVGSPSLPTNVDPMSGIQMTVDVSTSGVPFVDDTLDFAFSGVGTIYVPITIQRIVLWGLVPEQPYEEELEFLTTIYTPKNGSEKRESLRKAPRQSWRYQYVIGEGTEAQYFENLLFDFQSLTFGVPVWFEDTEISSAVTAGDTTINVVSTSYRDFRVGGLAVIFTAQSTFDVLEIDAGGITGTSLSFTAPTVNSYAAGTPVYPLDPCFAQARIDGQRWPVGLRAMGIRFQSSTNDVDLADLSAFSTYKGKLLLDNGNSMLRGTIGHDFEQPLIRIDGGAGTMYQSSTWDRHKRGHTFTLRADGRQAVWEMRQMVHALRGRQVSFYVPTDSDDLEVVADLLSASNTMDVTNVGYTQFVRNRTPKSDIRVNFVDGSAPLLRAITGSSSPSTTVDQLVVDTNWPSTITPAEISRVEYVEKVRLDTDSIRIQYDESGSRARMVAPIRAVFD